MREKEGAWWEREAEAERKAHGPNKDLKPADPKEQTTETEDRKRTRLCRPGSLQPWRRALKQMKHLGKRQERGQTGPQVEPGQKHERQDCHHPMSHCTRTKQRSSGDKGRGRRRKGASPPSLCAGLSAGLIALSKGLQRLWQQR